MAETSKRTFRHVEKKAGEVKEKVEEEAHELTKAKDPVCGAKIDKDYATATSRYHGKIYYFDSITCRDRFDINPDRYV
ncbi:MAG: YHS domain-containing protein [Thaumarchaeota archaeon]|nr:YHS domain-containing protein [Nitrososphaerota archaeon]